MSNTPEWLDPFSPQGTREATAKILTGRNYRLFYEDATRRTLIETYRTLTELARTHPTDSDAWRTHIRDLVNTGDVEDKRMRQWLIGLTMKTAQNLGLKVGDYASVFDDMMADIDAVASSENERREIALLLWCGTATLTIRGSQKSRIGKALEVAIARAALLSIGLREEEGHFRLNVEADKEVDRETDCEIRTPRGFLRMEVGLIGQGNPEVIGDKVGRMDRNGIILMDYLPARSSAYRTAEHRGVRLIQLRNNHPVEELRQHLASLQVPVQQDAISPEEVEQRVSALPDSAFVRRE